MPTCPVCGEKIDSPFAPSAENTGVCSRCGAVLHPSMRGRPAWLLLFSVPAVALAMVTARFKYDKMAALVLAGESLMARLLWKTGLVDLKLISKD